MDETYLECQACGDRLGPALTQAQQRQVADRPYDFVKFCRACIEDGLHRESWL